MGRAGCHKTGAKRHKSDGLRVRVIFPDGSCPGHPDFFHIAVKATNLAEKYQVPVFIALDQTYLKHSL